MNRLQLTPGKYRGLCRLSDADGFFRMTAVSQRPAMEQVVARLSADQRYDFRRVSDLKATILRVWSRFSSAVMVDPQYGYPTSLSHLNHRTGLVLAVERGDLERTSGGIRNHLYREDIVAKAKRLGVDAINLSLWFRPDADKSVVAHQKELVEQVGEQCCDFDIPFLLSPLLYSLSSDEPSTAGRGEMLLAMVREFQNERYGVDALQLENPEQANPTQEFFSALGSAIHLPWIMLTAGTGIESFREVLGYAFRAGASGYLGGRALWASQAEKYPDLDAIAGLIETEMVPVAKQLDQLAQKFARPWQQVACRNVGDVEHIGSSEFYDLYPTFEGRRVHGSHHKASIDTSNMILGGK